MIGLDQIEKKFAVMLVSKVQNYEIYDRLLLGQTSFLIGILLYSKGNEIKTNYDSDIIYWVSIAHVSYFSTLRHFLNNVKNIGWYGTVLSVPKDFLLNNTKGTIAIKKIQIKS